MSDNYSVHLYIEGPYDDLVSVTSELNFSEFAYTYSEWEIDGWCAVLHFESFYVPREQVYQASIKYPSLKIIFRHTHELISVGLDIYNNGAHILSSQYDWSSGECSACRVA